MGRKARFWSAEELTTAVNILDALAQEDEHGKHFGGESIAWVLYHAYAKRPRRISIATAQDGVRTLRALGFVAPRPVAVMPAGYKRRFYPHARAVITREDADAAWANRHEMPES